MVRLYELQALVHQARRVDRDLRPHLPDRVAASLFGRGSGEPLQGPVQERPAGGGQPQAAHTGGTGGIQTLQELEERVVLGVNGEDARARLAGRAHHQLARDRERLLVGDSNICPPRKGGQDGPEPVHPRHGGNDPPGRALRRLQNGTGASTPRGLLVFPGGEGLGCQSLGQSGASRLVRDGGEARSVAHGQLRQLSRPAAGGDRLQLEALRLGGKDIQRLTPDRAGRAQNRDRDTGGGGGAGHGAQEAAPERAARA